MSEEKERKVTTVQKLKSLIEAIDLMSEVDNWKPSETQWKKIKEMIETLEEPEPVGVQQATRAAAPTHQYQQPTTPAQNPQRQPPGPNPLESGIVNFPEVPVGEPPVIPDSRVASGRSNLSVDSPGRAQGQSGNESPEHPPQGPGL